MFGTASDHMHARHARRILSMLGSTLLLSYIPRLGFLELSLAMKLKLALNLNLKTNLLLSPDWSQILLSSPKLQITGVFQHIHSFLFF